MRSPSPATFPLSGSPEEFRGRNFYVVYVNDGTFTYYVDAAAEADVLAKFRENDKAPLQEVRLSYAKLTELETRLTHYFNEVVLSSTSPSWFLAKHFLGLNYLTLLQRRVVSFFRSLRTVNRDRRIDLLSQVAEMSLSQRHFCFEPISLITQKHGGYYWAEFRNRDETSTSSFRSIRTPHSSAEKPSRWPSRAQIKQATFGGLKQTSRFAKCGHLIRREIS